MASNLDRLGRELAEVRRDVRSLQRGIGIGYASFDQGGISQYDGSQLGSVFGQAYDGSNGLFPVSGPIPPTPDAAGITVTEITGGLSIRWNGTFKGGPQVVAPMGFKSVEVHVSAQPGFTGLFFDTLKTNITSPRGGEVLVPLASDVEYYVRLVTRTEAGKASTPSDILGPFIPQKIRQEDLGFDIGALAGTTIFYGSTPPTGQVYGDLWFKDVTPSGAATPQYTVYRWTPASPDRWSELESSTAASAVAAAIAAREAANSKAQIFTQAGKPNWSGSAGTAWWIDTANGNATKIWNGSDFVTYQIGNGAIKPNSLVASDVIATGTISAALFESILVLTTNVVAGNVNGTHAKMSPTGFYVYRDDPVSLGGDGVPDEVIRMGTDTNDFFGIADEDGMLVASIDDTGAVNARTANFREDIFVQGRTLNSRLMDMPGGGGPASGANAQNFWAENFAAGVEGASTEIGLIEFQANFAPNRLYKITPIFYWRRSANSTYLEVRLRDGGSSTPGVSSTLRQQWFGFGSDNPTWSTPFAVPRTINTDVTSGWVGSKRMLLTVAAGGGGTVSVDSNSFGQAPQVLIEDLGPSRSNGATLNRGGGGGGSTPPPLQQRFVELAPTNRATFRGNGTQRSDTSDIVQGWDPSGFNGDGQGWWLFDNLPSITGTVDRVDWYVYCNHTYYNNGGRALWRPIRYGTPFPVDGIALKGKWDPGFNYPKPGGVWVTLPADWWPLFRNDGGGAGARAVGIAAGPAGGTNLTYYCRFDGPSARLRVWYTQ